MVRVRSGDLEAYAELVRRHAPIALRTAVLLGAGSEGEDVVQEAFVKAYRSLAGFRDGAPFRPWLLRIVANEAHNLHRSAVRRRRPRARLSCSHRTCSTTGRETRRTRCCRTTVVAASSMRCESFRIRFGRSSPAATSSISGEAETATVLGLPRGTVKSRLSRGLGRLRSAISDDLVDQPVGRGARGDG